MVTKEQAITKLVRAIQDAGMMVQHIPSSTLVVSVSENETVRVTVGMVKK